MSATANSVSPETRLAIREALAQDRLLYRLPGEAEALYRNHHAERFAAAVRVGWPLVLIMFGAIIGAAWLQFHNDMHGWDGRVWWTSILFCSAAYAVVLPAMRLRAMRPYYVPVSSVGASLFLASQLASAMLIHDARFAQELTYVCMINNFSAMLAWGLPPMAGALTCLVALPLATLVCWQVGVSPDYSMVAIYHLGSILVLSMAALMLDRSERLNFMQDLLLKHEIDENSRLIHQLDGRNTELAQALDELKSAQTQLVQSEKMASLGQMIAGVAHEVNTPLGYVQNNVAMVRNFMGSIRALVQDPTTADVSELGGPELIDDIDMALDDTLYGIDQISQLVMGLKDFSRLDHAKVDHVSLNQCVESSLVLTRHLFKDKVQLVTELNPIPTASCAPSQINQVLLNLISNGVQAMPGGGTLTITTGSDNGQVFITIQDTGKGMSGEVMEHIFDPFYTTKPVGEGTGLGLSIVYQIVQRHGGNILVDSQEGVGSRFCVMIPCQNKIAENVDAATAAA